MSDPRSHPLLNLKTGVKEFHDKTDDVKWSSVSCRFHAGEEPVDEKTVIDEDTKSVITVPVYSENVGFQEGCIDCEVQAVLTWEHMRTVQVHDEISLIRYGRAERYG